MEIQLEVNGKKVIVEKFQIFTKKNDKTYVFAIKNFKKDKLENLYNQINKKSHIVIEKNGFYLELEKILYYFNFDIQNYIKFNNEINIIIAFCDENDKIIEKEYKIFEIKWK